MVENNYNHDSSAMTIQDPSKANRDEKSKEVIDSQAPTSGTSGMPLSPKNT
jgi:hypothetical protein